MKYLKNYLNFRYPYKHVLIMTMVYEGFRCPHPSQLQRVRTGCTTVRQYHNILDIEIGPWITRALFYSVDVASQFKDAN